MATAAIRQGYAKDRADFIADMRENGREVGFGTRSKTGPTWNPDGSYIETGKASVFPSEWKADFSSDVRADDLMFFVGAELLVDECTVMLDGAVEYSVIYVKPFQPDDEVIFYEIQVRV